MKTGDVFVLVSSVGSMRAFADSVSATDALDEQVSRLNEVRNMATGFGLRAPAWKRDCLHGFYAYASSGKDWIGVRKIPVEM